MDNSRPKKARESTKVKAESHEGTTSHHLYILTSIRERFATKRSTLLQSRFIWEKTHDEKRRYKLDAIHI